MAARPLSRVSIRTGVFLFAGPNVDLGGRDVHLLLGNVDLDGWCEQSANDSQTPQGCEVLSGGPILTALAVL